MLGTPLTASILILNYLFVTGVDGRTASKVCRVGKADEKVKQSRYRPGVAQSVPGS